MSEHHPHRESLEGFFFNRLPAAEVRETLGHLLGGCESCGEEISSLAAVVFSPESAPEPVLSAAEEEAYDRAIAAAFGRALASERSLAREREAGERRVDELMQALGRAETPA